MKRVITYMFSAFIAATALLAAGCDRTNQGRNASADVPPAAEPATLPSTQPAPPPAPIADSAQMSAAAAAIDTAHRAAEIRVEVSIERRELYVYRGGERTETYGVAVGSEKWPTRAGE